MTKFLNSLAEAAVLMAERAVVALVEAEAGLNQAAQLIKNDAKIRIGHYQDSAGPFPEWAELADSTEAEKERLGYQLDAPLLREGDLRDSIVTEQHGLEAVVGSKMAIAAYQEFGTDRIPPRPFLGPAAYERKDAIKAIIGKVTVNGLVNGSFIHPSLGYDITPSQE